MKLIKSFLALILIVLTMFANAGVWYYGNGEATNLEDKIGFDKHNQKIISGDTDDPTSVAKYGAKGSIYMRSGGGVYFKTDDGLSTNWSLIPATLGYTPENVANKENTTLDTSTTKYPTNNLIKTYVDTLVSAVMKLQGDWNANTNSPDISGTTTTGYTWRVSTAGTTNLGGITDWQIGDLAVKTATSWLKVDNEDISAVWGNISGTLSNQTDLNNALNARQQYISQGGTSVPAFTDNGDGTCTIGNGTFNFTPNADGTGVIKQYTLTGNTFTPTDEVVSYVVGDYNSGSPVYTMITDVSLINETTIVPVYTIFRNGTTLHSQTWDSLGAALPNKVHQSIVKTQRYRRESGLSVTEYGTRNLNISQGIVWTGAVRNNLTAVLSATDNMTLYYHTGGTWASSSVTQYDNTQYDNGTNLVTLTANRYAVNWIYRGIETQKHVYIVLGNGDYTLSQAQSASAPTVPLAISSHAVLIAKLIVLKSAATATSIQSAFDTVFSFANPANHNDLTGRSDASAHPSSAIDYGSSVVPTSASAYDIGSLLNPWNYIYGNFARLSKTSTNSTDQLAKINQTSLSTGSGAYGSQTLEVYNAIGTADSTTNSSGVSAAYFGAYRNLLVDGTNGNGTLASIAGVSVDYGHGARGAMATGTTTSAYGLYVTPRYSSGTITNMYDIFIANPVTGGTVTNKYGIYQENTAKNYFAGNVGIGTSAPSEKLDVKGTLAISGATSGAVKFAVPAAAGSATYTLPSADGASSSVLSTNGSGTLSWVSQTAGDAFKSTGSIYNGRWSVTVGSSNLTIALKNQAGNDPSAGDPVKVVMRTNAGASRICTISSAKSLVVTNGSSLGTRATLPHVLSIYLVDISASDDCTSVEVGVSLIRKIDLGSISTTAEGGAGGADTGTALYTTTAASSKQAAYVGNILITPAAGYAWTNAPTKVYLPGDSAMNDPVYAYACRDSSNQTVTNGTETTVVYNTRGDSIHGGSIGNGDTKNAFDTSTGIYTVVDPGLYRVDCQVEYNYATSLTQVEFWMKRNTTQIDYLNGYENSTDADSTRRVWKLSSTLQLAAGDTIKCTFKPYGANVTLKAQSCGLTSNSMQIVKLDKPGAL